MGKILVFVLLLAVASCRTAKHTIENYERVDTAAMATEVELKTALEVVESDTGTTIIIVEKYDTIGRVTTRATIQKTSKKVSLSTKNDTAKIINTVKIKAQESAVKEQKPVTGGAHRYLLLILFVLLIIVCIVNSKLSQKYFG